MIVYSKVEYCLYAAGVRELFEQEPPPPPRKTRAEMMKDIDADYYGYMDDDDGILIPLEMGAEKLCKFIR
jgi:pre-mRNA-splicing factor ISY1